MLNRRQFCFSLTDLPALFVPPADPQPPVAALPPDPIDPSIFPPATRATIEALERFLHRHPSAFSWQIHNELRRIYHTVSPEHAFYHANIILEHMPMDAHMLQVLSEGQLDKNPGYAIAALWAKVMRYPQFVFLSAASLIQIGDLLARNPAHAAPAQQVYRVVAAGRAPSPAINHGLEAYRQLAHYRLGFAAPARRFA